MQTNLQPLLFLVILLFGQTAFGQDSALKTATEEINQLAQEKKYSPSDYFEPIISDDYISGGIRHIYYQQSINNVGIYGTSGAVHLKEGEVISSNLHFLPQLEKRNITSTFQVQALEAVARLALDQKYPLSQTEVQILEANEAEPQKSTTINAPSISNRVIPMKLVYYVDAAEEVQLAWNLYIDEVGEPAYKNFIVSANDGAVLFEQNLTITCNFEHEHEPTCKEHHAQDESAIEATERTMVNVDSLYNVLPYNIESPNFGSRSILANPWENPVASPNGWHTMFGIDYEYTIGNNVDAYADRDNTNDPTGSNAARAFGGPDLVFDYPFDPNGTPTDYTKAAVTNLFYMNNVAHDVFFNYGFDEASGNFQEENYTANGRGSDAVTAEAQDASGTCNANMSTPGDGANPRMQMYICGGKDGDFDNAIILHEFGHGVSNRLTGGPNAVSCLGNIEQMGEGWSDYFGLVMTMKPTDVATTSRTIGTFMFNQDQNGAGLRPYPYTTAMVGAGSNPMTYKTIDDPGISRPHGVGAVWATMLWDMTWALIDQYGWDADIYNGTGGNNIALRLVMEGLKIQPCSPGFVDGRDAILAADVALYGGVNKCIIWEAFARRGLGYSADQGSTNSREDGSEGYDMPPECTIELIHTVDRETAFLGERLTFSLEAINHLGAIAPNVIVSDTLPDNTTFYSASHGGTLTGNVITWPAFDLALGESRVLELKVTINDTIDFDGDFLDDLESGGDNWDQAQISGSNVWNFQSQYYYSPSNGWFIPNANVTSETHLVLKNPLALTDSSELSFNHYFDLEDRYDFGLVDISIDGGENWINLEDKFTLNGYNNYTQFGHYAYSRYSTEITPNNNGFITSKADLSDYAGEVAIVRFRLLTDVNTAKFGWILDDVGISNTNYALPNFSNISNTEYNFDTQVETPVIINQSIINHTVEAAADTLITFQNNSTLYADVQANDIDPDGDILTTTILETATNGTAAVVNDDSISYIPNANFLGRDTVVYQVCDQVNACESDTLFIFVNDGNFGPITMSDFATVDENSTNNTIDVQANDIDPNEPTDFLTTTIVQQPTNGSASLNGNNIDYMPSVDYFGLDTIIYEVCDTGDLCEIDTVFLTIFPINQPPVAVADFITIDKNTSNHLIAVQDNDSDPDAPGDTLVTTIVAVPLNGSALVVNDDTIAYTPTTAYFGLDTIVYQVCDTSNLCASDTIFITINDINEAPTAMVDYLAVAKNSIDNYADVQSNDSDPNGIGDSLVTTILTMPSDGIATVIDNDSISYNPNMNFIGSDTIVYEVCDTANVCASDTLFVTIYDFNEGPTTMSDYLIIDKNTTNHFVNVQSNDSDPNGMGDSLLTIILTMPSNGVASVVNDDSISYDPDIDFVGLDTIVYQVCDTANVCASDTVFITINDINEAPTAMVDYLTVAKNSIDNYADVQSNDSDPNGVGDSLTTTILTMPSNGSAVVVDNDSISYTPNMNFIGLDTIIYKVCDTANVCASDTLFVTIYDFNEGPTTMSDYLVIDRNTTNHFVNVQSNDSDPNGMGDSLVTTILMLPSDGIASVINDDSISYDPDMDFVGIDTIVYQVCDTANVCASDTIFITVNDINQGPTAMTDFLSVTRNSTNNYVDVQSNDSDPNEPIDFLVTTILETASNGTASVVNNDSISYDPNMDYVGLDTIVYQVCDTANVCASDTVFITVIDMNLAPITQPDYLNILENTINSYINVQANDSDPNGVGDTLVTTLVQAATNGSTVIVDEDSIRYTPVANFVGLDTIIYQVCDTSNLCAVDTVFITVAVDNNSPIAKTDYLTINLNAQNVTIDVQANDYDPDGVGDTLETFILEGAFHGVAGVMNGDSLVYTPNTDYSGQDTIVYEVCDTLGLCAADTVFIAISANLICDSDNITKNENGVADGNYVAANMVTSAGIIANDAKVRFTAGNSVTLLPGFHAVAGADFIAYIEECDVDNSLVETPVSQRTTETTPNLTAADKLSNDNQLLVRPNPFSSSAIIDYEVGEQTAVWIGLHDLTGKIVHVFVDQKEMDKGLYQYQISSTNLPSGAYWVSIRTPKSVLTKKIIILKER